MAIHLPYGGSSIHRTIGCNGWVKKSQGIPPRPAGSAAIDGSMYHEVMERCQRDGVTPEQCLGLVYSEDGATRVFAEDDLDLAEIAYNATNKLLDDLDIDVMMVEPFVQLIIGKAGGSIDVLGLSADGKTLLVLDYKFGSVRVSATNNAQLSFYALAAQQDRKTRDLFKLVESVECVIVQPQAKGVVSRWAFSAGFLEGFHKEVLSAMDGTAITPGSHCKYCPAEPYCPEKRAAVMGANLLGTQEREEVQAGADMIVEVETWLKSMKAEVYLQLVRGVPIKGWKVVAKRPTTRWVDETAAREYLKDKRVAAKSVVRPAALLTPIQVGKILHKKGRDLDLSEFIISESSGTTMAAEDDSREAVLASDVQGHLAEMME